VSEYKNPFQSPEEEYIFLYKEYRRLLELKESYKKKGVKAYLALLKQIDQVESRLLKLEKEIGKERIDEIVTMIIENSLKQQFLV
jgi:isocitrate lyase